jgi:general stress protein 26
MKQDVFDAIWSLRRESTAAFLSYVDEQGYPAVRAMLVLEHDQIGTQYFSTNTSSGKVTALRNNPKASVYYCAPDRFQGALFAGDVEVCTDEATKAFLWREGFERYYPKGVTDPDYCVLKLTVRHGSHYHGLCNTAFLPNELE